MKTRRIVLALVMAFAVGSVAVAAAIPALAAPKQPSNGATLSGYKTLDICAVDGTSWRYSGVISVWNEGDVDTSGFSISDFIEYKTGTKFVKAFDVPVTYSGEIPSGTLQEEALTFPYSIDAEPVAGTIRNNASLTILNHSGHIGTSFGPNPKATYTGTTPPPPCSVDLGCTLTQGYWGSKPNVTWPSPFSRDATFFQSGQTWQQVMDTPVNVSQGYYQLAHQYVAAVLNQAKGAYVPQGVQDTLDLANTWLGANVPNACTAGGSCGVQKDWAATLDLYNNGLYTNGPPHCEE